VLLSKPAKLPDHATVGVVAPASSMQPQLLQRGLKYLKGRGHRVKLGKHLKDVSGFLAGDDAGRGSDLNKMFADPEVDAVFCARGGYGTPRILQHLDYELIRKNPKIFVGFSDITALQLALLSRSGLVSYSGPMVAVEMAEGIDPFTENYFWQLLSGQSAATKQDQSDTFRTLRQGIAQGRLIGGCLSIVCSMLGTSFLPDFRDAILFLEDVGEEPYRVDRNLHHLLLSGVLHDVAGIIFGQFCRCCASSTPSFSIDEVLHDFATQLDVPVVSNWAYGHVTKKYTMPLGIQVKLDTDNGTLQFLESVVQGAV
jgi:muramoyltetrapeptide carboxypeptidase